MSTVLVVEDDRDIAEMVELYLKADGYRTEWARDGKRALELWRAATPDLVLLDVGLPEIDGLEVLRRIRADPAGHEIPVLMLTARTEEIDELLGLNLGADDYITKPFSPRSLLARIKAALRRAQPAPNQVDAPVRVGDLVVDAYRVRVTLRGQPVHLTPTEFRILEYLARTPGRAVSRTELAEEALPEGDALERAVDAHVKNLRHKLDESGGGDLIETVRGVGYRLEGAQAPAAS